jgi:glycosyltransferase involved in cell wall biosynthesis
MAIKPDIDVAVVGQDPRFGGGFRSMLETFWLGSEQLGRAPHLFYLSRARRTSLLRPGIALGARRERQGMFEGTAVASVLPELDALNQVTGGMRIAPSLEQARSLWVVAASAPYGYAAVRSGRPYSCWIATSLDAEWAVRRPRLPPSRRAALRVNAPVLQRLEREVLRNAVAVYAISPYSRDAIADAAGASVDTVHALPIPIDFDQFSPVPEEEWRATLERPVIAFTGRASDPRKNLGLLLRAFARVRERVPAARLRLIGEGPSAEHAAALPEGVDVVGVVESVAEHLRTSTLFALPSLQEGFGIVAAEALACGVPAVVTPCGGPEDLVRESGAGRVLSEFDDEELAEAILDLLSDPDRLAEMRRRGRDHIVKAHSPERLRELLADAYATLDALS